MYWVRHIKWKPLLLSLFISLGIGTLSGLLTRGNTSLYQTIRRPLLSPPAGVFPVVWTILYVLMAISAYLIYESGSECRKPSLTIYGIQLVVNFIWPFIFFNLHAYLFAFLWLVLLWCLVLAMIVLFYRCCRSAAFLQIPYLLWSSFALYLNYSVWMLNK